MTTATQPLRTIVKWQQNTIHITFCESEIKSVNKSEHKHRSQGNLTGIMQVGCGNP